MNSFVYIFPFPSGLMILKEASVVKALDFGTPVQSQVSSNFGVGGMLICAVVVSIVSILIPP